MALYTMRNNLRRSHNGLDISEGVYTAILLICKKFYINLAWLYPINHHIISKYYNEKVELCENIDTTKLLDEFKIFIPALNVDNDKISFPKGRVDFKHTHKYYELLDYIELIANNVHDVEKVRFSNLNSKFKELYENELQEYMSTHACDEFIFLYFSNNVFKELQSQINKLFKENGLFYSLTDYKTIERILDNSVISEDILKQIVNIPERGIKELLEEAIRLFRSPRLEDRETAVEKIWDALERLKTYYLSSTIDKKASVTQIINYMSNNQQEFIDLFNTEFTELTKVGNNFRIRHHETNKTEIIDPRHYDYFFNRCLSLIALAIQYLK